MCKNSLKNNPLEYLYNYFKISPITLKMVLKKLKKSMKLFCKQCNKKQYSNECEMAFRRIEILIRGFYERKKFGFLKNKESRLIAYIDTKIEDKLLLKLFISELNQEIHNF